MGRVHGLLRMWMKSNPSPELGRVGVKVKVLLSAGEGKKYWRELMVRVNDT